MEHAIAHQTDKSRYVLTVDGTEAGVCHYVDAGDTREFNHTVIKDAFRGQGLSAPLIKAALDDARVTELTSGKQIVKTIVVPGRMVNLVVK